MLNSVPVLMYHHVSPEAGMISSTPENFESQIKYLSEKRYKSITLDEFKEHIDGVRDVGKAVLITFDDGYLDNWVYAFPILKKYGFKATIFLVTSWVNDGEVRENSNSLSDLPECPEHRECELLINDGRSDEVILRWSEIREMMSSGLIEFHSHTHTHTRWDLIENSNKNKKMDWELQESRRVLEEKIGVSSEYLCWPQGYFDDDYIEVAKKNGFGFLFTTEPFARNTKKTPRTHIHRFAVRNRPGKTLGKRIRASHSIFVSPIFNSFKILRNKLRK